LLLLLYGAALRISEALSLTLGDVDLENAVLLVRESKFYKSRWVPIGSDLRAVLEQHIQLRGTHHRNNPNAPLFVVRNGSALTRHAAEVAFCRLRDHAGVLRSDGARYQPRLHDVRHAAAVHRVIDWYRRDLDVHSPGSTPTLPRSGGAFFLPPIVLRRPSPPDRTDEMLDFI
jgi:integrase/recombinase XerD